MAAKLSAKDRAEMTKRLADLREEASIGLRTVQKKGRQARKGELDQAIGRLHLCEELERKFGLGPCGKPGTHVPTERRMLRKMAAGTLGRPETAAGTDTPAEPPAKRKTPSLTEMKEMLRQAKEELRKTAPRPAPKDTKSSPRVEAPQGPPLRDPGYL
jgi:hypothetical protein